MHQAAGGRVEGVAAVHRAAIVPPHEIADPPVLAPGEFLLAGVLPQEIEQRLALIDRQPHHISVDAAAEEQRLFAGLRVGADHRLARTRHFRYVRDVLETLMRLAAARMRRGVDHRQAVDAYFRVVGQRVVGGVAVEEVGRAAGASTNELSVCQNASPSPSPPIALPFSRMFEITEISGGISLLRPSVWVSTPYWLAISFAGLNSSSPNWRVNAMCSKSVIGWPRKRSTRLSSHALRMASRSAAASGLLISAPLMSAPQPAAKGVTVIAIALLRRFVED